MATLREFGRSISIQTITFCGRAANVHVSPHSMPHLRDATLADAAALCAAEAGSGPRARWATGFRARRAAGNRGTPYQLAQFVHGFT